jgi:hypothetical protein
MLVLSGSTPSLPCVNKYTVYTFSAYTPAAKFFYRSIFLDVDILLWCLYSYYIPIPPPWVAGCSDRHTKNVDSGECVSIVPLHSLLTHREMRREGGEKYWEKVGGRGWGGGEAATLLTTNLRYQSFCFRDPPLPPPPPSIFSASILSIHLSLYLYLYRKGTVCPAIFGAF